MRSWWPRDACHCDLMQHATASMCPARTEAMARAAPRWLLLITAPLPTTQLHLTLQRWRSEHSSEHSCASRFGARGKLCSPRLQPKPRHGSLIVPNPTPQCQVGQVPRSTVAPTAAPTFYSPSFLCIVLRRAVCLSSTVTVVGSRPGSWTLHSAVKPTRLAIGSEAIYAYD